MQVVHGGAVGLLRLGVVESARVGKRLAEVLYRLVPDAEFLMQLVACPDHCGRARSRVVRAVPARALGAARDGHAAVHGVLHASHVGLVDILLAVDDVDTVPRLQARDANVLSAERPEPKTDDLGTDAVCDGLASARDDQRVVAHVEHVVLGSDRVGAAVGRLAADRDAALGHAYPGDYDVIRVDRDVAKGIEPVDVPVGEERAAVCGRAA